MSRIFLAYSRCRECGKCCFHCEYLDQETGCTNHNFRLSSRCASFPLIQGNPTKMGYQYNTLSDNCYDEGIDKNIWFIFEYHECLLQQDEILLNNLRWILDDINDGLELTFYHAQIGDREISLEYTCSEN